MTSNFRTSISSRLWRGLHSKVTGYLFPLGKWWLRSLRDLSDPERQSHGLVIILPGIEGRSSLTANIARGLADAGIRCAVVIHDWTSGAWPLFLYHLRALERNRQAASLIAERIREYQANWP